MQASLVSGRPIESPQFTPRGSQRRPPQERFFDRALAATWALEMPRRPAAPRAVPSPPLPAAPEPPLLGPRAHLSLGAAWEYVRA